MRSILAFIAGGLTIWVYALYDVLGLFVAYFVAMAAYLLWWYLRDKYHRVKTLKEYAKTVENIYIYSEDATDHSKNRALYLRAKQAERLLEESGNEFSKVIPIYFQDHTAPNETPEQYAQRVQEFIAKDREKHLGKVYKNEGDTFYLRHISKQFGV